MIIVKSSISDIYPIEISNIASSLPRVCVFVCESNKDLWRTAHNFGFFCQTETIVFPEWDCGFYDRVSPGKHISADRMKALYAMLGNNNKKIILTTAKAILPLTMPISVLESLALNITVGDELDMDVISLKLIELGYTKVANAQSYGDYAIRGDIFDIACDNNEHGYRIDIYGNKIERIKQFMLSSQSSTEEFVSNLHVLPIEEAVLNNKTIAVFAEKMKTNNVSSSLIKDGIKASDHTHYLPFFYKYPACITNYFGDNFEIICTKNSKSMFQSLYQEIEREYARSKQDSHRNHGYPKPIEAFSKHIQT